MKRTGAAPAGHTALLQAAREEFAERGYDGTSIRQIAQRAGMSLSVLYHYYPGKTELLQAIVDEAMDAYFGACEAALDEAGEDPVRRLAALVTATIRFRAAYPSKGSLIQGEEHAFNDEFLSHYRKRAAVGSGCSSGWGSSTRRPSIRIARTAATRRSAKPSPWGRSG